MTKPLNIAHRGGAGLWPENTLFAFGSAARAGYDGAELDVQLTRDGKLAVVHDFRLSPDLCRDAPGSWLAEPGLPVCRVGYQDLRRLDVGRPRPGSRYAETHPALMGRDGEHIPLLGEVIEAVRSIRPEFRLLIEIKTSLQDSSLSAAPEAVAEAVAEEIGRARFGGNSIVVGFDWRAQRHLARIAPSLRCWFTTVARQEDIPQADSAAIAQGIASLGGAGWFAHRSAATQGAVAEAHARGLAFAVWTVNEPAEMRDLMHSGVDAICTDRPDILAALPPAAGG